MKFYSFIPMIMTFIGLIVVERKKTGMIRNWLSGCRPFISVHYIFPTVFGIFLGMHIFQKPVDYLKALNLVMAIFFSFQTSVIINDMNDIKTDQIARKKSLLNTNTLSIRHYQNLAVYFFLLSLLFVLVIDYRILLIVLLGHILHFTYSSSPFRLKRFYPISILMLSLGALLTAIAGYALFEPYKPFLSFPLKPALFIVIPLFLALNFRDLADYQGDKKTEITTLFTLFGLKAGRLINAFLILISYLSIPIILQFPQFFLASIPLGLSSSYLCLKQPFEEKYVFYTYFLLVVIFIVVFNLNPKIIIE